MFPTARYVRRLIPSLSLLWLVLLLMPLAVACGESSSADDLLIETVSPDSITLGGKPAGSGTSATPNPNNLPAAPTTGRWIDVDVTRFQVRLMDGQRVLHTIGPVGVGAQVDTGAYESTQTGLYHVYNKIGGLQYDAPYRTYLSDWVGFDPDKANGFHSFLKDERGRVVDASTGRVSNGCIRTGAAETIFAFAEIGMPVLVHH
jgi:hypothetical protein